MSLFLEKILIGGKKWHTWGNFIGLLFQQELEKRENGGKVLPT